MAPKKKVEEPTYKYANASEASWAKPFTRERDDEVYMRVRPVGWILNSELIQDCLNRGKPIAVQMNTGKLTILDPKEIIIFHD